MNFLKRELAPLTSAAWDELGKEAERVLKGNLSARRVVDVDGPKGFDYSAVNLGRLSEEHEATSDGVRFGIRKVLPLVELRVPFEVSIGELDNMARGADDVDTEPVIEAALKLARFEDHAIYQGFEPGGIQGVLAGCAHDSLALGGDAAQFPGAIAKAMSILSDAGVNGPYALILGPEPHRLLAGDVSTYPPRQRIAKMLEGPVLRSSVLEGGLLLSLRGEDYQLTIGEDVAIGYSAHNSERVSLYLTETFTFRMLSPEAAVRLC